MAYLGHRPAVGENNSFRILDDISSYVLTFDGSSASAVSLSNETITMTEDKHRYITGQRVTYSNGGGGNIAGLTNGQAYFVINHSSTEIKLASSASNALAGTAVDLTGLGTGSSHTLTLAFDGVNTKFVPTFGNGLHDALIKRAAQLVISLNGIIQQPHDTATPTTGFGVDALGNIIFSNPPISTDIFWAHVLASNTVTFDSSDNDVDTFTGNGSTTSFTLSKVPPDNRNILVTIDGVVQYPSDAANIRSYNVSENVMTFVAAPGNGTVIQVRHIGYAGPSAGGGGGVTGFYGRTGNVSLVSTDNIVANNATFNGNVSIAQTLTYEDVTDIDSVGLITARSGIKDQTLTAGHVVFAGTGGRLSGEAQLFYDASNNRLGIGTDNPSAKLDVTAGAVVVNSFLKTTSSKSYIEFEHNAGATYNTRFGSATLGSGNVGFLFETGLASARLDAMVIDRFGKVGIGTVNPAAKLNVYTYPNADTGGILVQNANYTSNLDKAYLIAGTHNWTGAATDWNTYGFQHKLKSDASGVPRLTIDASSGSSNLVEIITFMAGGNVGIGSAIPGSLLNLASNNPVIRLTDTDSNVHSAIGGEGGNLYLYTNSTGRDFIFRGTTEVARITGDGTLGIGTHTPASIFHLNSSNTAEVKLTLQNTGGTTAIYGNNDDIIMDADKYRIRNNDGSTEYVRITSDGKVGINTTVDAATQLQVQSDGTSTTVGGNIVARFQSNGSGRDATIQLSDNVANSATISMLSSNLIFKQSGVETLRIESGGNVGIGTDDANNLLHVYGGQIKSQSDLTDTSTNLDLIRAQCGSTGSALFSIRAADAADDNSDWDIKTNANEDLKFTIGAGDEKVRITSGGKIGIGTNNPNGQFHIHESTAGSVTAATDANDLVIESSTNVGMSLLTANNSLARIKFGDPDETGAGVIVYNHQNDKFSIVTGTGNRMIIGSDMISARTHYGVARTAGGYTFREVNEGGERAGMHSNASNHLIFKAGGADEKVRITNNGEVGIGITNPTKTGIQSLVKVLQIDGGDGAELILGNSQSSNVAANHIGAIAFKNIDNSASVAPNYAGIRCNATDTVGNMNLKFYAGSTAFESDTPHMTIISSGKIGIGTINPVSALDVRNASGTDPLLSLHHSEADVIGEVVRIGRVAPYHTIRYHSIKAEHSGGTASNMLAFHLHSGGSNTTDQVEVMRLRGDGRVVLGHTAANARLHVASGTSAAVGDGTNPAFQVGATTNYRFGIYTDNETGFLYNKNGDDGIHILTKATSGGNATKFKIHADQVYGVDDYADTGTGQRNSSQAHPTGAIEWQNNSDNGVQRFNSYIQATGGNETDMYITIRNGSFYRITVKASHNSTQADVAMYLVYGLNSHVTGNRVHEVTDTGQFTCTNHNTHVNTYDSTVKISYGGNANQGLRALVETIGGF